MNGNQPTKSPIDPEKLLPRDLQPTALDGTVAEAHLTGRIIHEFSGLMAGKMQRYQGRFKHAWYDKTWTQNELDLEIARCVMEHDYVSAANYAMMANHLQNQEASAGQGKSI